MLGDGLGRTSGPGLPPPGSWRFESEGVFVKPVSTARQTGHAQALPACPQVCQLRKPGLRSSRLSPGDPRAEAVPSCHSPENSTQ